MITKILIKIGRMTENMLLKIFELIGKNALYLVEK